jgi:hypothetical protein
VVTKDVRPYAVVAGNPGREVKRRFDDATVDYLLATAWWKLPLDFIAKNCVIFCSGDIEALKKCLGAQQGGSG